MSLGGPSIYPGVLSWLGMARELTAGTPLVPVVTQPLDQSDYSPEDMPKFLDDKAIRGSMTDLFYKTLGVESAQFSFGAPNFLDTQGYWFDNVFGDLSTIGSSLANPATVSGTIAVGNTSCTLASAPPSSYTAGATIQIGASATAEVVIVGSTAASNVVNFAISAGGEAYPLRFAHIAPTVQTCGTPFTHKWAALNSPAGYGGAYGAQPPTHSLTDVTNIVNVYTNATYGGPSAANPYGARLYPSAVLKSLDFSGNAEQLLGVKCAGDSWLSVVAGTAVTNVTRPPSQADPELELHRRHRRQHRLLHQYLRGRGELHRQLQTADTGVLDRRRHADAVHHLPRPAHRRRPSGLRPDELGNASGYYVAELAATYDYPGQQSDSECYSELGHAVHPDLYDESGRIYEVEDHAQQEPHRLRKWVRGSCQRH